MDSRSSLFSWYLSETVLSCIILPCLQTQGTVTAVQLQTEAPVVTASGQQVQTLQVVVSPPSPCVTTVLQPTSLHATSRAVSHDPSLCCLVHPPSPACLTAAWTACSSAQCVVRQPRVSARALMTSVCLSCVCLLLLKASYANQMLFFSVRTKAIWNMSHISVFCS